MLRMLLPGHNDPKLNRKIIIVRALFVLAALALVAFVVDAALRGGMPDSVPSTSRRRSGPRLVTWDASPFEFASRLGLGLLAMLLLVFFFGFLAETLVIHRHGARPLFRRRYPH